MILDLFAGPGGWDVAARALGLDPLGIEMDDAACATRLAAALQTWQGDVRAFPLPHQPVTGLIASPPCQTFSMAGKGAGRVALEQVLLGVKRVATGEPIPYGEYDDIRTGLVLEPLRYALELEPEWIAWEQVPTVLPVWQACAEVLREDGYSVWTGNLHAEQYGVPQTRKRAVFIAHRSREMTMPPPTHSRFYSRNRTKLDMGVAKWVSMAEALGWGMTQRPSMTVTGGGTATGGAEPFGNAARQGMQREVEGGRWLTSPQSIAGGPRAERADDEPAVTVTSNFSRAKWQLRNNTSANAAVRDDEPAPTLYFGARANGVYWQGRNSGPGAERAPRSVDEPSYTIRANGSGSHPSGVEWQMSGAAPATELTAGQKPRSLDGPARCITGAATAQWVAGNQPKEDRRTGSVRVTVQEAAVLQSFPPDYPWAGSKTKQYQQVGNAIPPGLADAVLRHVLDLHLQ